MWATLIVFAASCCVPVISIKAGPYFSIVSALKQLVVAIYQRDTSATQLFGGVFVMFGSMSMVFAIIFGWLLHCLVVIVRVGRHKSTNDSPVVQAGRNE